MGKYKLLIATLVLLVAVSSITTFLFYVKQKKTDAQNAQNQTEEETPVDTSNWKTYTNAQYNFSFKYPPTTILNERRERGTTGYQLCLEFSETDQTSNSPLSSQNNSCTWNNLVIGGIDKDFSAGREGSFLDTQGFRKEGDITYFKFVQNSEFPIPRFAIKKIYTNPQNVEIAVINGLSPFNEAEGAAMRLQGTPGEGYLGAIINVNDESLPGLAVVYKQESEKITKDDFSAIINSFTVNLVKPPLAKKEKCISANGKWLAEYEECENVEEDVCENILGGVFSNCESACRHDPSAQACIQLCVPVCSTN